MNPGQSIRHLFFMALLSISLATVVRSDDWPMFGRDWTRNAVSPEKNPPLDWHVKDGAKKVVDGKIVEEHPDDRGVRWHAKLGSLTFSDPVVSGGLVWIGTNNGHPRDAALKGDASVLMCFRERDGAFLWQYGSPRHPGGRMIDWPESGINCSPLAEGDRLWFTTNRCETVCLDVGSLRRGGRTPRMLWKVDMIKDLGVHPMRTVMSILHTCSPAGYKDCVYVITGNGVDEKYEKVKVPEAPSLVCFEKETGKVRWKDASPGKAILDGQWGSPLVGEIGGRAQVIAPFGDGWLRSFDARTGEPLWQFDSNPKAARFVWGERSDRNTLLTAPVLYEGKVYIANGRRPEMGDGPAWLHCIDPTKFGDVSPQLPDGRLNPNTAAVWSFGPGSLKDPPGEGQDLTRVGMSRSVSNIVAADGLVIVPTIAGYVHCLNARTGTKYWTHDAAAAILPSPLVVDGKVFVPTEEGDILVFALSRERRLNKTISLPTFGYSSPVFASGVLYVATRDTLYAIGERR